MNPDVLKRAIERLEILGTVSDRHDGLQRTFLSPANRRAGELLMEWMRELGMATAHDAGGTVRGILSGKDPGAKPLLIGSHLDTVINAGKYDGALGVIAGLAALEELRAQETHLVFPVHLLGFSDEEGVRFQSAYLGSAGVVGELPADLLAARDESGASLEEVIDAEGWHEGAEKLFYDESSSSGYVELHIEQGRVLEDAGEALAVVSGICAQARLRLVVDGLADHAGTTPMNLRRDALAGAAECILAAETMAKSGTALVATVGMIRVSPGASNAIPQVAEFTLDVRHCDQDVLEDSLENLRGEMAGICRRRNLKFEWTLVQINRPVACDPSLTGALLASAESVTGRRRLLSSGAGHDGVLMANVMPIGMLFLRCRAGLSHHPAEFADPADIELGIEVLVDFLKRRSG